MPHYERLRGLLAKEEFPLFFTFKFIGKNSPVFEDGVEVFQKKFPLMQTYPKKYSGNQKHISVTFAFNAAEAEEIISVFRSISEIPDLVMIL